jgi:hypothetical protein
VISVCLPHLHCIIYLSISPSLHHIQEFLDSESGAITLKDHLINDVPAFFDLLQSTVADFLLVPHIFTEEEEKLVFDKGASLCGSWNDFQGIYNDRVISFTYESVFRSSLCMYVLAGIIATLFEQVIIKACWDNAFIKASQNEQELLLLEDLVCSDNRKSMDVDAQRRKKKKKRNWRSKDTKVVETVLKTPVKQIECCSESTITDKDSEIQTPIDYNLSGDELWLTDEEDSSINAAVREDLVKNMTKLSVSVTEEDKTLYRAPSRSLCKRKYSELVIDLRESDDEEEIVHRQHIKFRSEMDEVIAIVFIYKYICICICS